MAIDLYDADRHCHPGEPGGRAPPRCYTRPAISEGIGGSRLDEGGNAHVFAFGTALIVIWCVAAFVILQNGWSF